MRIGIDATGVWGIQKGLLNGIMIYTLNITKELVHIDNKNNYYIYCREEVPHQFSQLANKASLRILNSRNRKVLQQTKLPLTALKDSLDIFFFPYHSASILCPCKNIVTIHDLFPYVVPDRFKETHSTELHKSTLTSLLNRFYWRTMLKAACMRAHRIIAVSNSTKKDILDIFRVAPDNVHVVSEAVDTQYFNTDVDGTDSNSFRLKYDLKDKYILCVGTHAYKNLRGILKSFYLLKKQYDTSLQLCIVGNKTYLSTEIFDLVRDLNLLENVLFTGFFPAQDLKYLYQNAELLLFPSFYEGFGLPVLEAFACGTPVVTSTAGSLPEVAGQAALQVDPYDHEKIASAVYQLLTDENLREKKRLQGFRQLEKFTWENAARQTLAVFEDATKSN